MDTLSHPQRPQCSGAANRGARAQRGVTLLQLTVMLAALIALVVGLSYKTSDYFSKSQVLDSDALLRLADNQLRQYVIANGRLPCPDLDGTGNAAVSCSLASQQKGYLPYLTLGMAEKNYVYGEVPILYGVYSDGTVNLAGTAQIFYPSYADKDNASQAVTTQRNIYDFCASLATLEARASAVNATGLSMAGQYTAVFALALPGAANRDGLSAGWGVRSINAQYDGLNATSSNQFELPQKTVTPTYDDRTAFRAAADLRDYLRCEAMNYSVSLLSESVTMQKEVEDFADANSEAATYGLVMNAVGIALAAWELGQTIADIASASEQIGIASGLLAAASATCPIPPWVTCALIPVYAAALSSASVGMGLSIGAAVAAGIGVGLNITATVLYADLKSRTSTAPSEPVVSISNISAARVLELKNAYNSSLAAAKTAFAAVPNPAPVVATLKTNQENAASALATNIAGVTDGTLRSVLSNDLNGSSLTCDASILGSAACLAAGYVAKDVPLMGSDYTMVKPNGTLETCIPGDHPANWCPQNGYTQTLKDVVYSKSTSTNCDMTVPGHDGAWCLANGFTKIAGYDIYSKTVDSTCDPAAHLSPSWCYDNGFTASGTPRMTQIYTKDGLSAPYKPGVIPSLDYYYQGLAQAGISPAPDPAIVPADAMNASNAVVSNYGYLLADVYDFDVKNLAYVAAKSATTAALQAWINGGRPGSGVLFNALSAVEQAWVSAGQPGSGLFFGALSAVDQAFVTAQSARGTALTTLQTQMGNGAWNYTGSTSLCGGGASTGCGWMTGGTASAGNASTPATTGSSAVNDYLSKYEAYRDTEGYQKLKDAATNAANSAWSDRNGYKTALCATSTPSVTWLGGADHSDNPSSWDNSEKLLDSPVTGLVCTGSATASSQSSQNDAARAAEIAKYCPGGSAPDAALCALYSAAAPTRSSIQGAENIVNSLIQKGIVR